MTGSMSNAARCARERMALLVQKYGGTSVGSS